MIILQLMITEMSNGMFQLKSRLKLQYAQMKEKDPLIMLKIITLNLVDVFPLKALVIAVCLIHGSISVIHIAELAWTFDSKLLVQYGPVLFGTFYGLVAIMTSLWCEKGVREILNEMSATRWPLERCSDVLTQRIRDESQAAIRRAIFIITFTIFTSFFFWPIFGHENEMYFALTLLDRFSQIVPEFFIKLAAYTYYGSFSILGYNMVAYTFMSTYLILHQNFQIYLLQQHFQRISQLADVDEEEKLLSDESYQATVAIGLRNGIRHHVNMKKWIGMMNVMTFGPLIAFTLSGIVFMTSDIVYIFTDAPKSSYPRTTLLAVMAFITIVTASHVGQSLIDESEKLFVMASETPWPTWNKGNRRTLLMFLMMAKDPLILKTSDIIVINNTFIVRFFRALMSIYTVTKKCMIMKKQI